MVIEMTQERHQNVVTRLKMAFINGQDQYYTVHMKASLKQNLIWDYKPLMITGFRA